MSTGHHKDKSRKESKHASNGKYRDQFIRTVLKTGRWRGKPANVSDAFSGRQPGSLAHLIASAAAKLKKGK